MPPHAEGPAIFHFLDGKGQMVMGSETFAVRAGATVMVPDGAVRGSVAETRLAFWLSGYPNPELFWIPGDENPVERRIDMAQTKLYPVWHELVAHNANGPTHQDLIETDGYKAVLVGLVAGQKIPPHPAAAAAYHFLEGSGWMLVDGERLAVGRGATVVVPAGIPRGVEAETKLSFLGSHGAAQKESPRVSVKFSVPIMLGLVLMLGLMIRGMIAPAQMMSRPGGWVSGIWGVMVIPGLGLLAMLGMMFVFYWRMAGGSGTDEKMMAHQHVMTRSFPSSDESTTTLAVHVPAVHCGHCKMTIERAVGEIQGVTSIQVDVETRMATVKFGAPATRNEIETVLTEISYPPGGKT